MRKIAGKFDIKKIPRPGLRNIKTSIAVFLTLLIFRVFGQTDGVVAAIAALICMQDSVEKSISDGLTRIIGTTLGILFSVIFLILVKDLTNTALEILFASIGLVVVIFACNLLKLKDSAVVSAFIYLIVVLDVRASGLLAYAVNRMIETVVGITVAVLVNHFLFRPRKQPIEEMNMLQNIVRIIPPKLHKTTQWSGGVTTELFIFPQEASYANRNFNVRISTATVEQPTSTFTPLVGYDRHIMPLSGQMHLAHEGHHAITLDPFEMDFFAGDWTTTCQGVCTDFNLMLSRGLEGKLCALKRGEPYHLDPSCYHVFYLQQDATNLLIYCPESEHLTDTSVDAVAKLLKVNEPQAQTIKTPLYFQKIAKTHSVVVVAPFENAGTLSYYLSFEADVPDHFSVLAVGAVFDVGEAPCS